MINGSKKSQKNGSVKLNTIWDDIRNKLFESAHLKYTELSKKDQDSLDGRLALVRIYGGLKNFPAALNVLNTKMTYAEQQLKQVVKANAYIFYEMRDHDGVIKLCNKIKVYDLDILLLKIKSYARLDVDEVDPLIKKIKPEDRKKISIKVDLSKIFLELNRTEKAEQEITTCEYKHDPQLARALMFVYMHSKQYEKAEELYNSVRDFVRINSSFLIIYLNGLLEFQGDIKEKKLKHDKAETIALILFKRNLTKNDLRKIVLMILRNGFESNEVFKYVDKYRKENPSDDQIALYCNISKEEKNAIEGRIFANPGANIVTLRSYMHQNKNNVADYEKGLQAYKVLIENDKDKKDHKLWFDYANFLGEGGKHQEALDICNQIYEVGTKYSKIYTGLAHWICVLNKPESDKYAEAVLKKGLKVCPRSLKIALSYSKLLNTQDRYHEVVAIYEKLLELCPDYVDAKIELSQAYVTIGHTQKAKKMLLQELDKSPDNPYLIVAVSYALIACNEFDSANRHLEGITEHALYWKEFSLSHAICYEKQEDFDSALRILVKRGEMLNKGAQDYLAIINACKRAVKLNKYTKTANEHVNAMRLKFPNDTNMLVACGFYYIEAGDYDAAKDLCMSILQKDPNNTQAHSMRSIVNNKKIAHRTRETFAPPIENQQAFKNQILIEIVREEIENANKLLNIFKEKYPNSRILYYVQASYYLERNKCSKAIKCMDKIKEQFGGYTLEEKLLLVKIYRRFRMWEESEVLLESILVEDPNNLSALGQIAGCYLRKHQIQQAFNACFTAMKMSPNDVHTIMQLANIERSQQNYTRALIYLTILDKLKPNDLKINVQRIKVLRELEHYDAALQLCKVLEEKYPKNRNVLLQSFYIYFDRNQLKEAGEKLNALQMYHDNYGVLTATIRYKLAENKYNKVDIDALFKKLISQNSHKSSAYFEYASYIRTAYSVDEAITLFEEYIENKLQHCSHAYEKLALLYIEKNRLTSAEKIYNKGISNNPEEASLYISYLNFILTIKHGAKVKNQAVEFYQVCWQKLKNNPYVINVLNQAMFRAGFSDFLVKQITDSNINNSVLEKHCDLSSIQEVMSKISALGYGVYALGGAPRFFYLSKKSNRSTSFTLHDVDLITDCPPELLTSTFNGYKSPYISNQVNFIYKDLFFDVSFIGVQMLDPKNYLISLKPLSFDCLLMDKEGKFLDVTGAAFKSLDSLRLETFAKSDFRDNPTLLFRILRHIMEYGCYFDPGINAEKLLQEMSILVKEESRSAKVMAEMIKIILRGRSVDTINFMINCNVLQNINPDLNFMLNQNSEFRRWFYGEITMTDEMVKNERLGLKPSRNYLSSVYLMGNVMRQQYEKKELDEIMLNDLMLRSFGDRKERPQILRNIGNFFVTLKYSLNFNLENFTIQQQELDEEQSNHSRQKIEELAMDISFEAESKTDKPYIFEEYLNESSIEENQTNLSSAIKQTKKHAARGPDKAEEKQRNAETRQVSIVKKETNKSKQLKKNIDKQQTQNKTAKPHNKPFNSSDVEDAALIQKFSKLLLNDTPNPININSPDVPSEHPCNYFINLCRTYVNYVYAYLPNLQRSPKEVENNALRQDYGNNKDVKNTSKHPYTSQKNSKNNKKFKNKKR
ncbi:MAG: tetratricopeptide repeat protein [Proteobacteria bacterium]|nr:tetratricopeptide repeat protein [Pseudomonadota bacterium]